MVGLWQDRPPDQQCHVRSMLLGALLGSRVDIFPIRPYEAHSAGRSSCICRVIKVSVRVVSLPGIPLNCRIIMCLYLEKVAVGHPLRKSPVAACSLPLHPNLNHWPPLCDKKVKYKFIEAWPSSNIVSNKLLSWSSSEMVCE